ncbi:hypothetical protein CFC21_017875 [Triticum aestivum]|uniref:DUF642 domain-containing protein n=3 Tax=Triticum TaxID=4564 RepID=A0A9R1NZ22_TRITD|nr:uncharacterized protein LOC119359655 [Triticum dicoccoides]XP_044453440.1 uncharacterized protein LOC123185657 [Triticum aestivum]KAF7002376.1 hypothetical protein CFC21_017875 [Triticum aestivum]VAH33736.1 unnamed protein product [Triticum turgidum subsp. durum]
MGMAEGMRRRCITLLVLVGVAARAASAVTDGLLPNGNFKDGPAKSQLNGTVVMGRHSIPNWEISGFVEYIQSGHTQDDMIVAVPEGASAVRLGNDASIRQNIRVTRRAYYSITFSAARTCAQAEKLNVSVAADSGVLPVQTVYSSGGWDSYSWAFRAKHSAVWLAIHNPGVEEDPACGPVIDAIAIKTLQPPTKTKGNMLRNGDFEDGPYIFPDCPWGVLVPPMDEDNCSPLPGWMVMSSTKVVKYVDAPRYRVPHGARAVELVAGRETALVQEVATVAGRSYRLQFYVGDAANGCKESMVVEAYVAAASLKVQYQSQGTGGYRRAMLDFVAIGNLTRVVFQSLHHHMKVDGTLCGPVVDDISLVSVRKRAARRLFM